MTDTAALPDDVDALKAIIAVMDDRTQRLEKRVAAFRDAIFGQKSEKTGPDQYELDTRINPFGLQGWRDSLPLMAGGRWHGAAEFFWS